MIARGRLHWGVGLLVLLAACNSESRDFEAAEAAYYGGDRDGADSLYRLVVRKYPTGRFRAASESQLEKLGSIGNLVDSVSRLEERRKFAAAANELRRLLSIEPSFFDTLWMSRLEVADDSLRRDLDTRIRVMGIAPGTADSTAINIVTALRSTRQWGRDDWNSCVAAYLDRPAEGRVCQAEVGTLTIELGVESGEVVALRVKAYLGAGVGLARQLMDHLGIDLEEPVADEQRRAISDGCVKNWGTSVVCEVHRWLGREKFAMVRTADGISRGDLVAFRTVLLGRRETEASGSADSGSDVPPPGR